MPDGWVLWVDDAEGPAAGYGGYGSSVPGAASPAFAGPNPQAAPTAKKRRWPWIIGGIIVFFIAISQCGGSDDGEEVPAGSAATSESSDPTTPSTPEVTTPAPVEPTQAAPEVQPPPVASGYGEFSAEQQQFVDLVIAAQQAAQSADNDLQLASAKATREGGICSLLPSRSVTGWTGKLVDLDANNEGKGVLMIEIAPDVEIGTWNNAFSDIGSDTLIEPDSPVFAAASQLSEGQLVRFSGQFLAGSDTDCLYEASLTLRSNVERPSFRFRFSEIGAG